MTVDLDRLRALVLSLGAMRCPGSADDVAAAIAEIERLRARNAEIEDALEKLQNAQLRLAAPRHRSAPLQLRAKATRGKP